MNKTNSHMKGRGNLIWGFKILYQYLVFHGNMKTVLHLFTYVPFTTIAITGISRIQVA